ncbi:hypothetical protein ACED29_20430 [Shewanella sp. 5S214]|uniref:hypothetical protein n=1 Tax=Shewanella TaxID=22 RepID=UPI00352E3399
MAVNDVANEAMTSHHHHYATTKSEFAVFLGDVDTPERLGMVALSTQLIDRTYTTIITVPNDPVYSRCFDAFILRNSFNSKQFC